MTELDVKEFERREAEAGLRRPVRVLYVVDDTRPSYRHKQLVRMLGQFRRMQLKAAVASLETYGDAAEKIQGKNVPVVSLEMDLSKGHKLSERFGALLRLRNLIEHNQPEVLHLIGENARNLGILAASSFRALPVVCQTRPAPRRGLWTRFLDLAAKIMAPKPTQLFFDDDEVGAYEKRFGSPKPFEVIGHGIDFAAAETAPLVDFDDLPADAFYVGLPVTSERCASVLEMLKAFKIFRGHRPDAKLVLIGDNDELNLSPWLEDLELEGHVLKRPLPPEPGSLMGRLNVLWVHDEIYPDQELALQAMAVGLYVVIDHTTGLAKDIREIGGAMMRDAAWPQQFAEATREMVQDEELQANVGRAGKIVVRERHTVAAQAEKLRSLYARIVHNADV